MALQDVAGELAKILGRREREAADLVTARVQGRNTDGTVRYLPLRGECELRGQLASHQTGQIVEISSRPAFSRRQGAIGAAFGSGRFGRATVWVESLSPSVFSPGDTGLAVTVTGKGFAADVQFDFLDAAALVSADITTTAKTVVSDTQVDLTIDVDGAAALISGAQLAYGSADGGGTPGAQSLLTRRKDDAYSIEDLAVPYFYAFLDDGGGNLVASIYSSDGEWIEDRDTLAVDTPSGAVAIMIASDSNANVADASLAWRSADDELSVWDVDGATLYTYTAAVGELVSPPVYHAGYVYWWEIAAASDTWYFRRALCDLTSPETVASQVAAIGPPASSSWNAPEGIAASSVACIGSAVWQSGETTYDYVMRATWAGTISLPADWENVTEFDGVGWPDTGGYSLHLSNQMYERNNGVDDDLAARWPTTGDWEIGGGVNAYVTSDGATALAYADDAGFVTRVAIVASSIATGGNPTLRVEISEHPTTTTLPALLFLLE